jgi:uncharacterized membrane protein
VSSKKDWIRKYFSEDEMTEIQNELNEVERNTSGEIILSIRNKKKLLEKLYSNHELAFKDFDVLGVANTSEMTGVLIFIIFEERYYDIIADEGIYKKIPDEFWNVLEEKLKIEFKSGNYSAGILELINGMGTILRKEFPVRAGAVNDDEIDREIVVN